MMKSISHFFKANMSPDSSAVFLTHVLLLSSVIFTELSYIFSESTYYCSVHSLVSGRK